MAEPAAFEVSVIVAPFELAVYGEPAKENALARAEASPAALLVLPYETETGNAFTVTDNVPVSYVVELSVPPDIPEWDPLNPDIEIP